MTRLLAGLLLLATGPAIAADRPNVVLILADDKEWNRTMLDYVAPKNAEKTAKTV